MDFNVADVHNGRLLLSIKSTCMCCGKEMIDPSNLPPEFLAYDIQVDLQLHTQCKQGKGTNNNNNNNNNTTICKAP